MLRPCVWQRCLAWVRRRRRATWEWIDPLRSQWSKQAAEEGVEAFRGHGVRTAHDEELIALRRRITVLEPERDILKKAAEFFMKEQQ